MRPYRIWLSTFLTSFFSYTHSLNSHCYLDTAKADLPQGVWTGCCLCWKCSSHWSLFTSTIHMSALQLLSHYWLFFTWHISLSEIIYHFHLVSYLQSVSLAGIDTPPEQGPGVSYSFACSVPRGEYGSCFVIIWMRKSTEHFVHARAVVFRL